MGKSIRKRKSSVKSVPAPEGGTDGDEAKSKQSIEVQISGLQSQRTAPILRSLFPVLSSLRVILGRLLSTHHSAIKGNTSKL